MPKNKDFKRLVRARMKKTGESYTAAHTKLLAKAVTAEELTLADVAGYADATVEKRTGHTWAGWLELLDKVEAAKRSHREIAQYVRENFEGVSFWWAQSVTVGYERIKGLREIGQEREGLFEANKSKTFAVPVERLFRAFSDTNETAIWLPGVSWEVRTSRESKSMRVNWPDETRVDFYFTAKGDTKSSVALQHRLLPAKADIAERKAFWAARLAALGELLDVSLA